MDDTLFVINPLYDSRLLMPAAPNKDEQSRIGFFLDWLAATARVWHTPDLAAYRDYLLYHKPNRNGDLGLSRATVQAHLATIRGRYAALLRDNRVREALYALAPEDASPADQKALVDEALTRLQNAVHPSAAPVTHITRQDHADTEHLRLKPHQVTALLRAPGIDTLAGLRDTAIIALLVCTGLREAELCALDVDDLRQGIGGELALRVREGKGGKQRLVPYGSLDWCLVFVERWQAAAAITGGAVFRGLYKGRGRVRPSRITTRAVNQILNRYPILIDGRLRGVKPHDLRRTYARSAYEHGMDMERIRQNLGHTSIQTTQRYIGELHVHQRRPPLLFAPPYELTLI